MKFRYHEHPNFTFDPIILAPAMSVVLLLLLFFLLSAAFTTPQEAQIKLPKVVTSDVIRDENDVISITREDIIHFNNQIVTMKELRKLLAAAAKIKKPILIKADRWATMGRVVDIWDLCRENGIEKINIATSKEK